MMGIIVFPDVEALVSAYLAAELSLRGLPFPVGTRVPNPRPDRFFVLRRTGGPRSSVVTEAAQMTIESWAPLEEAAYEQYSVARGLLLALPGRNLGGYTVYRVDEFSGPANLPDPRSGQVRYSQTVAVHIRGAAT